MKETITFNLQIVLRFSLFMSFQDHKVNVFFFTINLHVRICPIIYSKETKNKN